MKRLLCLFALFLLVGVASADTLIFQIAATANDGYVSETTDSNWQTITDAGGDGYSTALGTTYDEVRLVATANVGEYTENRRGVFLFNTSSIPDGDVIDSVDFAVYGVGKAAQLGEFDLEVVGISYVAGAGIAATLYNNKETNRLAPNITYDSYNTGGWNNFTFNSEGKNYINKTGVSAFMLMNSIDYIDNSTGLTWLGGNKSSYLWRDRSSTITTNIPTLTIVYHTPDLTPPASITNLSNQTTTCQALKFSWTNPSDGDYDLAYILKNNTFFHNITAPANSDLWTGLSNGTYEISIKTVDNSGNMNGTWVNQTVIFASSSCPPPMGSLIHNETNLTISTYDGSGQIVHPSLIYSPSAWNGYHYLMGLTPYPGASPSYENPSMRYSNDLLTWEKLPGGPDPVIPSPPGSPDPYNSDINIVLNNSVLYLFHRINTVNESLDYINWTSTTDGITWTPPVKTNLGYLLSPSILYNGTGWEAWGNPSNGSVHGLTHYVTSDLINWTESGTTAGIGATQWHSEVKFYDNQYQLLLLEFERNHLYYYNSSDGLTWIGSESNPVLHDGNSTKWYDTLYKSTFLELNNTFYVIYGGYNTTPVYKVAYTSYPSGITPPNYTEAAACTQTQVIFYTNGSSDGQAWRAVSNSTYSSVITGVATSSDNTTTTAFTRLISSTDNQSDKFRTSGNAYYYFNTSSLPDTATVVSATLSVMESNDPGALPVQLGSPDYGIVGVLPHQLGVVNLGDYTNTSRTRFATDIPSALIPSVGTFTNWSFNVYGLSNISKTTFSNFSIAQNWYINQNFGGVWVGYENGSQARWYTAEAVAGAKPFLTVNYTDTACAVTPLSSFFANTTGGNTSVSVQFNDTSTNTPTSWNWSYTNVTGNSTEIWFSTVEDPVITFGVGNWSIHLNATNAAGTNKSVQNTFVNVSGGGVSAPVASFTIDHVVVRMPQGVVVTDTSTNTPTSWQWSWGDGAANSTFQSGVHQYQKRGNWNIVMTATNAGGSSTTTPVLVRVIGFQND